MEIIDDILWEMTQNKSLTYTDISYQFEELEFLIQEIPLPEYQQSVYDKMLEELYICKGNLAECVEVMNEFKQSISE